MRLMQSLLNKVAEITGENWRTLLFFFFLFVNVLNRILRDFFFAEIAYLFKLVLNLLQLFDGENELFIDVIGIPICSFRELRFLALVSDHLSLKTLADFEIFPENPNFLLIITEMTEERQRCRGRKARLFFRSGRERERGEGERRLRSYTIPGFIYMIPRLSALVVGPLCVRVSFTPKHGSLEKFRTLISNNPFGIWIGVLMDQACLTRTRVHPSLGWGASGLGF